MNPIFLSGKAGSGKDTVCKILQCLSSNSTKETLLSQPKLILENMELDFNSIGKFKKMAFADPLKVILAMMIGVDVTNFESPEFKKSFMPSEWNKYKVDCGEGHFIYLDSFDEQTKYGYGMLGIALPREKTPLTFRQGLQFLGTDAIRNNFHEDTFVNMMRNNINKLQKPYVPIVSDLRLPNEYNLGIELNALMVRIVKDTGVKDSHVSETALDNHDFDIILDNNSSYDNLVNQITSCNKIMEYLVKS